MTADMEWERAKELIRSRVDLISLVGKYVRLERKGNRYWAPCPFHNENEPSFTVTPEMGLYKCFGCGKGGDVFNFIMEIEGCDFGEALRELARETGVELPSGGGDKKSSQRQDWFELNRYVADCYRQAFTTEPGKLARDYMTERGFDLELLDRFEVGYASPAWNNLVKAMKRDGKEIKQALELGLLKESKGRKYDFFRDRVIFPIHDISRRIVGFGGRALNTDDKTPKYLNTPETPIFSKRNLLYGLRQARRQMREREYCLVMEGYTDVICCHGAGFETAVAALGTALTATQVRLLKRYVDEVILVYDGDEAGRKAIVRGGKIALQNGLTVTVAVLPEGSDPADIISRSPEEFERLIANRRSYPRVFFDFLASTRPASTARDKSYLLDKTLPLVRLLPDRLQQEEMVKWLAVRLGTEEDLIFAQLARLGSGRRSTLAERIKNQSGQTLEEQFFVSLANHPESFEQTMEKLSRKDFLGISSKPLVDALFKIKKEKLEFTPKRWLNFVPHEQHAYLAKLLSSDQIEEFLSGVEPQKIAEMIKKQANRHERAQIEQTLGQQAGSESSGKVNSVQKALLKKQRRLKQQEENQA